MSAAPDTRPAAAALVFTDLDATLLDHHSYDWSPAKPALDALAEKHIPVIFNTSKTAPECAALQARMGLSGPYIVENGSAVHGLAADDDVLVLGKPRADIVDALARWRSEHDWPLQTFSELGVDGVIKATGLPGDSAQAACNRAWSEPCLWRGSVEARGRFADYVRDQGYGCLIGGRFVHVLGDTDKGRALQAVVRALTPAGRPAAVSVALGDSPNDTAMLKAADIAVRVHAADRAPPDVGAHSRVITTDEPGPAGWNAAMLGLIRAGDLG